MSDKETAPWMFRAAHRGIEYLSAATGCLKGKTHGEATRLENELAQIIAKHAVECTAPAPQLTCEDLARTIWKADEEWHRLQEHDQIDALADWGEWIGSFVMTFLAKRATPQVTPTTGNFCTGDQDCRHTCELELEQEADGRWLAAYARFAGVAAYGPSKEEAIRNAAKVLIQPDVASEQASYPNDPSLMCAEGRHKECTGGNRPWWVCGCACHKKASEQASPTPEQCPTCSSADRIMLLKPFCFDSWHSSAATQKGTK